MGKRLTRSAILSLMCIAAFACMERVGVDESTDEVETTTYPKTAGFVTVPERFVTVDGFGIFEQGTVTSAKLFYSFVPATVNAALKPIFVIFNGGPGAATSSALAAWGTGPFTMTPSGEIAENPGDVSTLGNLIYIDARQAGFSFDEIDDPSSAADRSDAFNFLNFNLYTDVSNILFCLLQIIAERPLIEGNPIVIIAESFGGARSAVLLSLVRDAAAGEAVSGVLEDGLLFETIRAHLDRIGDGDRSAAAARQFAHQVLIQPGRVLPKQVESSHTLYSLCDHIGDDDPRFVYCDGRVFDYTDMREPEGFFDERNEKAQSLLLTPSGFEKFFGTTWTTINALQPHHRRQAFRFAGEAEVQDGDMEGASPLEAWDAHHITMHIDPYFSWQGAEGKYASYDSGAWAAHAFVRGLATVHTFITDAYYDYAVDSSELPGALLEWNFLQDEPVIKDARYISDLEPDAERPGWLEVTFAASEPTPKEVTRIIRMPIYKDAGHMVPMYQSKDFLADVRAFLQETGLFQINDD